MSKRVALVGHCGPDSSFLRMAVSSALPGAQVVMANNDAGLKQALNDGVDLLLFNRVLDFGFEHHKGVELLKQVKADHPDVTLMMVSNYPEAQREAEGAGAVPGFGKSEIGSEKVRQRLRDAVANA